MPVVYQQRFRVDACSGGAEYSHGRYFRIYQPRDDVASGRKDHPGAQTRIVQSLPEKTCPTDFRCMTMITVDDVVAAAHTLLKKS